MTLLQSRRDFAGHLSLAGAAGLLGGRAALADEAPPETTTITLLKDPDLRRARSASSEELHARGGLHRRPLRRLRSRANPTRR